jgi:hypothetical protein
VYFEITHGSPVIYRLGSIIAGGIASSFSPHAPGFLQNREPGLFHLFPAPFRSARRAKVEQGKGADRASNDAKILIINCNSGIKYLCF